MSFTSAPKPDPREKKPKRFVDYKKIKAYTCKTCKGRFSRMMCDTHIKWCSEKCKIEFRQKMINTKRIKVESDFKRKKRVHIKAISKRLQKERAKYTEEVRLKFLEENPICPVTKGMTTQIHHRKGRQGYADQWAYDNKITLLNDQRFWLAVSAKGHDYIENHPAESYEKGWSLKRL